MEENKTATFLHHGKGSKVYDEEGKEYIDYVNSQETGILGHANDKVVEAVKEAAEGGLSFTTPIREEELLADLIHDTMPVAERVQFVSSSTEAVMGAIRLARAYTGREYIIKFTGCYHGIIDGLLVEKAMTGWEQTRPNQTGIPKESTKYTLLTEFNDIGAVEELFWSYEGQIAAVIIEPVAVRMGLVPPKDGFLEYVREVTNKNGSLLIFDETMTAYRLRLGGASEYYHITPDLICMGKSIGGGLPIGLYGGRADVMKERMREESAANPLALAAGITTISELVRKKERYSRMQEQAVQIQSALETALPRARVVRVASLFSVFFTDRDVSNEKEAKRSDASRYQRYYSYMMERGIYIPSSRFGTCYLSMAHKKDDIKKTCDIIKGIKKGAFGE